MPLPDDRGHFLEVALRLLIVLKVLVLKMQPFLVESSQGLDYKAASNSQESLAAVARHSLIGIYTCPCCSDTLLRHIRLGGIYWRCSHCHQEMLVKQS